MKVYASTLIAASFASAASTDSDGFLNKRSSAFLQMYHDGVQKEQVLDAYAKYQNAKMHQHFELGDEATRKNPEALLAALKALIKGGEESEDAPVEGYCKFATCPQFKNQVVASGAEIFIVTEEGMLVSTQDYKTQIQEYIESTQQGKDALKREPQGPELKYSECLADSVKPIELKAVKQKELTDRYKGLVVEPANDMSADCVELIKEAQAIEFKPDQRAAFLEKFSNLLERQFDPNTQCLEYDLQPITKFPNPSQVQAAVKAGSSLEDAVSKAADDADVETVEFLLRGHSGGQILTNGVNRAPTATPFAANIGAAQLRLVKAGDARFVVHQWGTAHALAIDFLERGLNLKTSVNLRPDEFTLFSKMLVRLRWLPSVVLDRIVGEFTEYSAIGEEQIKAMNDFAQVYKNLHGDDFNTGSFNLMRSTPFAVAEAKWSDNVQPVIFYDVGGKVYDAGARAPSYAHGFFVNPSSHACTLERYIDGDISSNQLKMNTIKVDGKAMKECYKRGLMTFNNRDGVSTEEPQAAVPWKDLSQIEGKQFFGKIIKRVVLADKTNQEFCEVDSVLYRTFQENLMFKVLAAAKAAVSANTHNVVLELGVHREIFEYAKKEVQEDTLENLRIEFAQFVTENAEHFALQGMLTHDVAAPRTIFLGWFPSSVQQEA